MPSVTLGSEHHLIPKGVNTAAENQHNNNEGNSPTVMLKSKLKISSPVQAIGSSGHSSHPDSIPRTSPVATVVLVAEFDFKAENKHELTISAGEVLKLIERKGNGWILVKPVGRLGEVGLIPASYVHAVSMGKEQSTTKIDENCLSKRNSQKERCLSPKSLSSTSTELLKTRSHMKNALSDSSEVENHFSFQSAASSASTTVSPKTSPKNSISGIPMGEIVPVSGLVKNAEVSNGRYWYRVDIVMSDGKKRHLCRYYQDFYKLHCALVNHITRCVPKNDEDLNELMAKLPSLPDPIARPDLETLQSILLQRCQSLNVYIFKLVQNKSHLNYGKVLTEWARPRLGDIELAGGIELSGDSLHNILDPMPTNTKGKPLLTVKTSVTPPLPQPMGQPMGFYANRTVSGSSQTSLSSLPAWPSPTLSTGHGFHQEKQVSTPTIHEGQEKGFEDWLTSPVEPLLIPRRRNISVSSTTRSDIKAKVFHNGDIFALRVLYGCKLSDLKGSIAKRLECDLDALALSYKLLKQDAFFPLEDDKELTMAMDQEKLHIGIKISA